ncbi:MAG: hypothetical protein HOP12_08790 [Candidatus Eisenbacteria bacterium]|uniref:FlgD/Vpr Ig-like domain-containing protein n=1 Tax=Eiseniibacteriota bacterium TaxID=2212470 RepID=A0A849SYT7_UNCEI|nr:hypothetical protein [Candidatus Eisenbacteria bacterium]
MYPNRASLRVSFTAAWVVLSLVIGTPEPSNSQPVVGFIEDFAAGTGAHGWSGGIPSFGNPNTGGVLGAADGFLRGATVSPANWGLRCRGCTPYTGDWNSAGITQLIVWLNDVGVDEPFEMHVTVGNDTTLWQYDIGFVPPSGHWAPFVVDLTDTANFTQINGLSGTLATTLSDVSIVLIRHDLAPFPQVPNPPDPIQGDAGIDQILLTDGIVGVAPRGTRAPAGPLRLLAPYPNPASGPVAFGLEILDAGPVTLDIVDVFGRRLRRVELTAQVAGPRTWLWDGRDESGRRVPAGRYRVVARSASGGESRSFTRLH